VFLFLHIQIIRGIHCRNQIQAEKKRETSCTTIDILQKKRKERNRERIIQSFLVHHLLDQPNVLHEIHHNVFYVLIQIVFFVLKKFFVFKLIFIVY